MYLDKSILKIFAVGFFIVLATTSVDAKEKTGDNNSESSKTNIIEDVTGISVKSNRTLASLYEEAVEWLKTPYRRGGMSHKGMDCSGLASTIYKNVFDIKLQRSSRDISKVDVEDISKEELKPGDLVFFATSRRAKGVNHVGVYLGNSHFVHASVSKGVIVSSLDEGYYQRTWVKGGRPKEDNQAFQNLLAKHQDVKINNVKNKPLLINDLRSPKTVNDILPLDQGFNVF